MSDDRRMFNGSIGGSISRTPSQARRRSGSFSAEVQATVEGQTVGTMKLEHSVTRRTTTISSIMNTAENNFRGVGSALIRRAEHIARQSGAVTLETTLTAPSAQGFYRSQGLSPNPEMFSDYKQLMPEASDAEVAKLVPVWQKDLR